MLLPLKQSARPVPSNRRRRAAAEVELLLVLPILFAFLWLIKGSSDLGSNRLDNVFQAETNAYTFATLPSASPAGSDTGSLSAPTELNDVLPPLPEQFPNRMHVGDASRTVVYALNLPLPSQKLDDKAAFPGPAWSWSAWPAGDSSGFQDATTTQNWFSDYTGQVRTDDITNALELSPSSPP